MSKTLIKEIKSWVKDFEKLNPAPFNGLVDIDNHTFEGSAYELFIAILREEK